MPRAHLRVVSPDVLIASGGLAGTVVDVVIGPPVDEQDVQHETLFEERPSWLIHENHPRVGARLSKKRFCEERHVDVHVALGRGGRGHEAAEAAMEKLGLVRDVAVTVPTFTAAAWLASTTELIAGVPRSLAEALRRILPVRIVPGPHPTFAIPIAMSWHLRTDVDPGARAFRDAVRRAYLW